MTMSTFVEQRKAAEARYAEKRPLSKELFDRASTVMPGGSTRSVLDVQPFPFRVASAAGCQLTDVDGLTYIDFLGDYSAGLLGHDPAPVRAAVHSALENGWSFGGVHADEIRAAEAVVNRFPSIEQVRFTNSGTEANLMALQLARHHTGRDRIVVCDGAYHGGLLDFGHGGEALLAPFDFTRVNYNDSEALSVVDGSVAAVLIEPMMGAGGCIPASQDYLEALRRRCDESGALFIFDEVMTSRMSAGGLQQRTGVMPDLTTLGKYLAGGMTFGAFGGRSDVMAAFDPARGGTLTHGGTFNNNVVSMAAATAALSDMLSEESLSQLFVRGESLRSRLNELFQTSTLPFVATGVGSMMAIHTFEGPVRGPHDLEHSDHELKQLLFHEMLHRGCYFAPRGFIALSLAIADEQCDIFVTAMSDAIDAISASQ